jgi:hypothetical protein
MGLFFEILSAINNPNQEANIEQLGSLTNSVQQLAQNHGMDSSMMQSVMSMVGSQLQTTLGQQGGVQQAQGLLGQLTGNNPIGNLLGQVTEGDNPLGNLMGQVTGGGGENPALGAIQSLLPQEMQQQLIQGIATKTGLDASSIQGMLPTLIPAVLNLLKMGSPTSGAQGSNSILQAFLDSNQDGKTDLGDVFNFANRFLNSPT